MPSKTDLIVIAVAKAKPGMEQQMAKALRDVAAPTRAQKGLVSFALFRKTGDKSTIVGFEHWASRADHDKHLQGAHVQKLMGAMGPALAGPPDIVEYEVIEEA